MDSSKDHVTDEEVPRLRLPGNILCMSKDKRLKSLYMETGGLWVTCLWNIIEDKVVDR